MRFVVDARYAAKPSGISTYVRALGSRLPALARSGEEFRFWVAPRAAEIAAGAAVTHHRVRAAKASLATLLIPSWLDALRRDDVFHAPANILGYRLPCRTVLTLHDILWLTRPDDCQPNRLARPFSRRYFSAGIHQGLRAATRIITVSHASADSILAYAPVVRDKLVVIPNAADPEFRPPSSREAARARATQIVGSDQPYFLVLGHNQASKGHRYALEGFSALKKSQGARLVFVQRLNRGGELYRMAQQLGVGDRVSFLGALSRAEVVPLMQGAAALVQPSLSEGFGIPVLEAMSVGCPVIASDIPALREVLGGAGLLATVASSESFGVAMKRVLDEPSLREELRTRGLERAPAYSWDRTAAETLEVYRDVAGGSA